MADRGTLFLDEISNISLNIQAKLLRVIQEQEVPRVGKSASEKVDVRLIAASNRDVRAEIEAGRFREDLFYRISVVPIHIRPLREHRADILPIAEHYLDVYIAKHKSRVRRLSEEAKKSLVSYRWPGNVRELKNTMERVAVMTDEEMILPKHFPLPLQEAPQGITFEVPKTNEDLREMKKNLRDKAIEEIERLFVLAALGSNEWNVTRSARDVGMLRPNFQALMRKYNIKSSEREE